MTALTNVLYPHFQRRPQTYGDMTLAALNCEGWTFIGSSSEPGHWDYLLTRAAVAEMRQARDAGVIATGQKRVGGQFELKARVVG
jgi:hypothetical protein